LLLRFKEPSSLSKGLFDLMKRTRITIGFATLVLGVAVPAMAQGFGLSAAAQKGAFLLSEFVSSVVSFVTPEPTSLILLGMGGLILVGATRRRKTV